MTTEQDNNLAALLENMGTPVTTAFLIYQTQEGNWTATAQFQELNLELDRESTFDDIIGGTAAVHAGCISQQSAMHTVMIMEQRAAALQEQMRQQAEANKVSSLIDPTKLRNPRA